MYHEKARKIHLCCVKPDAVESCPLIGKKVDLFGGVWFDQDGIGRVTGAHVISGVPLHASVDLVRKRNEVAEGRAVAIREDFVGTSCNS